MKEPLITFTIYPPTRDASYRSCRYREDSCYSLIGKRKCPAHDEPSKWHYQDTHEESWEFFLKCVVRFTGEYLHHCHPEKHKGKYDIDEIAHEHPYIDEIRPKTKKVTHRPVWRQEPASENDSWCEEKCDQRKDEIEYLYDSPDDIRITLRLTSRTALRECIARN